MSEDVIPEAARQFLLANIDSVAEWEGLLLLRAYPKNKWDAYRASRNLYISEDSTAAVLMALEKRGLVTAIRSPGSVLYRYNPATKELAREVDFVADLYGKYLIAVTQIIHSKARNRVQAFADSFKFRKE